MSIENHVVSLEIAKKLKDYLPKEFESCFYFWGDDIKKNIDIVSNSFMKSYLEHHINTDKEFYPAPLLTELLELLPKVIYKESIYFLQICAFKTEEDKEQFWIYYTNRFHNRLIIFRDDKDGNIIDCAALLYMWLIDNGYVKNE